MTKNKKSFPYAPDNIENEENIITTKNEEILQPTDKKNSQLSQLSPHNN